MLNKIRMNFMAAKLVNFNGTSVRLLGCEVCGHVWIPREKDPPVCSNRSCRSALWDGSVDGRTKASRNNKKNRNQGQSKR